MSWASFRTQPTRASHERPASRLSREYRRLPHTQFLAVPDGDYRRAYRCLWSVFPDLAAASRRLPVVRLARPLSHQSGPANLATIGIAESRWQHAIRGTSSSCRTPCRSIALDRRVTRTEGVPRNSSPTAEARRSSSSMTLRAGPGIPETVRSRAAPGPASVPVRVRAVMQRAFQSAAMPFRPTFPPRGARRPVRAELLRPRAPERRFAGLRW